MLQCRSRSRIFTKNGRGTSRTYTTSLEGDRNIVGLMEVKIQLFVSWVAVLLRTASGLENAIFVRKFNSTMSSNELKLISSKKIILSTRQDAQTILRKMSKESDRFVYFESGKHYLYGEDAFMLNPILDSGSGESRIPIYDFQN